MPPSGRSRTRRGSCWRRRWVRVRSCVCDLAWISGRVQNLVSHHLRVLRSHGLVSSRRDGKLVMYSLADEGRSLLEAVLGERAMIS
jgi:ArsR family transcriptional regulator, lead/cadmium/zinc/bismuth-responsive transcriptional repressor